MSPLPTPEDLARLEARITELEMKVSFGEELADRLNEVIVRQQAQIDRLAQAVGQLRQDAAAQVAPFRSLREELPPHY